VRILIVEDESPVAEDLRETCARILGTTATSIRCEFTLGDALEYIAKHPVDVMFLDLNLSGRNGFDLLKTVVSYSFHTIVISANVDRALEAFEYGVVDFVPKPYNEQRIRKALDRLERVPERDSHKLKYLSVRQQSKLSLIAITEIEYIKGADVYSQLSLRNGTKELHDKSLNELSRILPSNFLRIHKSFIVDVGSIVGLKIRGGGKYAVELKSHSVLPVSRAKIVALKSRVNVAP
jgi:two-component system response regulator LytT